jgi:hypothetical protein
MIPTIKSLIPAAIIIVILWLIVTGLLWGFTQTSEIKSVCQNGTVMDYRPAPLTEYCIGNSSTGGCFVASSRFFDDDCYEIPVKRYYTLPETLQNEGAIISWAARNTGSWIMAHRVI